MFSDTVNNYWRDTFRGEGVVFEDKHFSIATTPALEIEADGAILEMADKTLVVLREALARQLLSDTPSSAPEFHRRLDRAGIKCHGADHLFYFPEAELKNIAEMDVSPDIRLLTEEDAALFNAFCDKATEDDLDAASVELDHWLVAGAFEDGELVSAASMYPWDDTKLADTGVLTLPHARGKGYASRLFRGISHFAIERGFEPQYRCQLDNLPSVALAKTCGLVEFGKWDVILSR